MKILYVCTELFPLLKTGGLADVGAALPAALRSLGNEVRLLLPAFPGIAQGVRIEGPALPLGTEGGPDILRTLQPAPRLLPGRVEATGQPVYLLDAPALYQREGGPYLDAHGREWTDSAERFALLCWAAAGLGLGDDPRWQPDIIHAHDWHAGLTPVYLQLRGRDRIKPACVFTIHNLAYQGVFPASVLPALGLPESLFTLDGIEFYGQLSFMKAGLQFADAITTVSPRYAREIMTPEQGCGLDGVLRYRADRVTGILNGVDYSVWDPSSDPLIDSHFDAKNMPGKSLVKSALQQSMGLEVRADAMLCVAVTRLSEQKGLHLVPAVLDDLIVSGGQLLVLGSGDAEIETAIRQAVARFPGKAVLRVGYDEPLAHRIMAAADVVLVPSRFEPCGLTQLYGLRYGALPLVRAVGGLADTVTDCTAETLADHTASGFTFHEFTPDGLRSALGRAFALYRRPADWIAVQHHAMQLRFDWQVAAQAYAALFQKLSPQSGTGPA